MLQQTLTPDVRERNRQVLQTYWNALMSSDLDTFATLLRDDTLIHYPGNHFLSGDYRGPEEVIGLYRRLTQFIRDGIFVAELLDVLVGDVYCAAVLKYELHLPIRKIPGRATGIFHLEDGKIKEYWLHEWDQVMINRVMRLAQFTQPLMERFARH